MPKPNPDQYAPFFQNYIGLVAEGEILEALENGRKPMKELLLSIPTEKEKFSYEPGKWTINQVILHITDTERIMAYRALRFARNDQTNLPGFDQDNYIHYANISGRTIRGLLDEFLISRESTISLFRTFDELCLKRMGMANGKYMSVEALGFIIAGHAQHHLNILKMKYLSQ
ncbi:MAG: DinB family protein [Chitinophagaceae bacterium]